MRYLLIFLLIMGLFLYSSSKFNKKVEEEKDELIKNQEDFKSFKIERKHIEELPEPIKRWLVNSGVIGTQMPNIVNLKQTGVMNLKPKSEKWINSKSKQIIGLKEPSFVWTADIDLFPIANMIGRDLFLDGNAKMEMRILNLIPVVNEGENKKINESALHRYLLEIIWYPQFALSEHIKFETINDNKVKAILNYNDIEVEAVLFIDNEGNLSEISAKRYKENKENSKRYKCVGKAISYKEFEGIKVPDITTITWHLDDGPYTWFKVKIDDITYEYGDENEK